MKRKRSQGPDPAVLSQFRKALEEIYGERIERVVLFGSRARGEAARDSDYDIAVFINGMTSLWQEAQALAPIQLKLLDETGVSIDARPLPAESWRDTSSPLIRDIRREGLVL
jgi:uncharacterized protein